MLLVTVKAAETQEVMMTLVIRVRTLTDRMVIRMPAALSTPSLMVSPLLAGYLMDSSSQ